MLTNSPEKLDELIRRVQNQGDVSSFQKDPSDNGSLNLVSIIAHIPKAEIPKPDLMKIRKKILGRISIPAEHEKTFSFAFLQHIPRFIRITGGVIGGLLIIISMTLGTAVAALGSVPGETIYPVKIIVENMQLKLAGSEEQRTNLQIKFANNRVEELETILQKQKEGKISEEQVQKVVNETVKDIRETSQAVAEKNMTEPKPEMLNKIVSLSSKQTAVIQAAQVQSEGEIKLELQKALELSKTTTEQAIENIERAGLVVENKPFVMTEIKKENSVSAEGKVTAVTSTSINIGTAQFLLTRDTEYVNIKPVDLKVDITVRISAEIRDKKTYALKLEAVSKPEVKSETTTQPQTPPPAPQEPQSNEPADNTNNTDQQ